MAKTRKITEAEIVAAAGRDPDNPPLTKAQLAKMRRIPLVRRIRRGMGISQEEFSARFRIPLGTLRDWEQGRRKPDQAAKAYLAVIAYDHEAVAKALVEPVQ